jgi:hypothetical protein
LVSHAYEIQRDSSYAQLRAFVEDNGTTDQTMVVYAYLSSHTGFQGLLGVYITSPSAVTLWQTGLYVGDLNYTPPGTEINPVFNRGVADNATRNLVFRQASQPTGQNAGDLWFDTDDKNRLYYYSGSAWQDSRDTDIAAAISAAGTAQATADGKIDSFFQTSAPVSGMSTGDLWFDTDDKNKLYRYSGSAWVAARDADIGNAIQAASDAQSTADGKVTTFYAASAPTAEGNGDLWFNTNTGELRRWNLSSWIVVATANSIFRQSATPTGTLGAIWYNTTTSLLYRHNGTAWELIGNNYTLTSQLTDDAGLGDDTDWFSLGSMPDRFNETTTAGLNFTDQVLGYHNGTAMVSYITSDGHFYFSMDGNNYIAWNGTNFEIKAGNVRLGSNGNAAFTGDISASAISGTTITGSTITGGTITGGEFRTDTSPNTRMVLNRGGSTGAGDGNNQLEFYLNDGSGEEKLVSIGTDAGIIQDHGLINVGSPEWELFGVFAVNNHYTNSTVAAVNSGGGAAIYGMSSATGFVWEKSVGVYGIGPTAGVCGDAQSEPQNACGVIGICTTTAYTSGDFPAGVKGTATLTWQYGVYGENAAFVGVGGTGITGVYGSSPAAGGKGLHGSATGTGAVGVMAESGNGDGCQASGAAGYYDFRATGAGTNGPFTGAHDGLMIDPDFEPGDIICVTGIVSSRGINDWIGSMVVADQDNMINAFGIITFSRDLPDYPAEGENDNRPNALTPLTETEYNDVKSTYKYVQANGVGEGMINVCSDGGDIEAGDWICTSTVRGKGKVYHGADSRAIVAKAAEAVIWANEPETTKLIACKYKTD